MVALLEAQINEYKHVCNTGSARWNTVYRYLSYSIKKTAHVRVYLDIFFINHKCIGT
jgi:hypothetical protein